MEPAGELGRGENKKLRPAGVGVTSRASGALLEARREANRAARGARPGRRVEPEERAWQRPDGGDGDGGRGASDHGGAGPNPIVPAAPFGAIKDVTILSALTGNLFTLLMVLVTAPFLGSLPLGINSSAFIASASFILISSVAALFLRKRLFTLPRRELWFVAGAHTARIVISALLAAVMWHLLLPSVALSWWLILSAARQLLSRLPFLPNKDVVFAGLAVFLVGSDQQIIAAMTLMATLILAAHLFAGATLGLSALVQEERAR